MLVFNLVSGCNVPFLSLSYSRAVADPQSLLEEKEAMEEKLAISEYELRLAQEDISKLKIEMQKKNEAHSVELIGKFFASDCFLRYNLATEKIDLKMGKFGARLQCPSKMSFENMILSAFQILKNCSLKD